MASGYALPSSRHAEAAVDRIAIGPSTQDQSLPRSSSWISPDRSARGNGHDHRHAAHSHHESIGTGYHTARSSVTSIDRKEVLHGTGVAMQHTAPAQWSDQLANASAVKYDNILQAVGTGCLIVLPLLVASLLQQHASKGSITPKQSPDVQGVQELREQIQAANRGASSATSLHLVEAMILASAVLLLLGILVRLFPESQVSGNHAANGNAAARDGKNQTGHKHDHVLSAGRQLLPLAVPCAVLTAAFYAALQLGGWRVGLAILTWQTKDLTLGIWSHVSGWRPRLQSHWLTILLICIATLDFLILAARTTLQRASVGYIALAVSLIFMTSSALQTTLQDARSAQTPTKISDSQPLSARSDGTSNGLRTARDLLETHKNRFTILIIGAVLSVITVFLSTTTGVSPSLSATSVAIRTISITFTILAVYFAVPSSLNDRQNQGFCAGAVLCILGILVTSDSSPLATLTDLAIASLVVVSTTFESVITKTIQSRNGNAGSHIAQVHGVIADARYSAFTQVLLQQCEPDSLFHSILIEKDSRRIMYFTCLNFAFMLVQGLYGYLSGSLGLLSDTVHMFFDCLGLIVGLGAAVASKWPRSAERPFGWANLNTLAGFGNGIFLMLVSVEFAWEAIEGILDGRELRRVKELLVVSTLGLLVNLVGLFAFGHAHAGHDHGHSHGHDHSHPHGHPMHDHAHGHQHGQEDPQTSTNHNHSHDHQHAKIHLPDKHAHNHAHNENMHGIFLHVAADAGGSLAVIISTALTLFKPWYLWDPLATIIIATLIFAAAVPLVQSSGRMLLLIIPEEADQGVKGFLQEVAEVRGALGYAAPRFWLNEQTDDHSHAHDHQHHGGCDHDHATQQQITLIGSVHVIAAPFADLDDVRERVQDLAAAKGIRATVQVEYETDAHCWCGGSERL